jgi:transposase
LAPQWIETFGALNRFVPFHRPMWESAYSEEGQRPHHPMLLLKVLLYGFALGVRSSRKLEQRVREDLGFRYLAGGAEPDHKTICEFLRRHGRRVNDLFTAVLEQLQAGEG